MGVLGNLVSISTDHMFYLVESFDSGGEFPIFGGTTTLTWATLQSDATTLDLPSVPVSGQFKQVIFASIDGIGLIAAGAGLTQGQARALFLVDQTTNIGNDLVPRAETEFVLRDGLIPWSIDATTTGILITAPNTSTGGEIYLRIRLRHSLWR